MTATAASTIRDIVEGDYRAAAVLHRYHIEFCCGGEGSLAEACRQRGVDPGIVLEEVTAACGAPDSGAPRFAAWDAETLVAYIVGNHHQYVRDAIPMLLARTTRIAAAHQRDRAKPKNTPRIGIAEGLDAGRRVPLLGGRLSGFAALLRLRSVWREPPGGRIDLQGPPW